MLTEKQFDLARYIETYIRKKGRSPTFQEMCEATGAKTAMVFQRVMALETRGILSRERGKARGIKMLKPAVLFAPLNEAA